MPGISHLLQSTIHNRTAAERERTLCTGNVVLGAKMASNKVEVACHLAHSAQQEAWLLWVQRSGNGISRSCYCTQMWQRTAMAPVWRCPKWSVTACSNLDLQKQNFYSEKYHSSITQECIDFYFKPASFKILLSAIFKLHIFLSWNNISTRFLWPSKSFGLLSVNSS